MAGSRHIYWRRQLDNLAVEISHLSIACKISILEPGIAERILRGDSSVCGHNNPEAFAKIRKHLMAYFQLEEKAIQRLGADEVKSILDDVRESLRHLRGKS